MLSVVVTVYNIEKYIENCLKSIINQSYRDIEIIVVDDGSYDASGEICEEFAKLDKRITTIHQVNKGPHEARRTGLNNANGEYIIFIDGDDEIDEKLCEKMLFWIKESNADFVHCNFLTNGQLVIKGIRQDRKINYSEMTNEERKEYIINHVLSRKNEFISPSLWSKIFNKQFISLCFEKIDSSCIYGEDLILLCHIIMNAKNGIVCKDALYNYMQRDDSLSQRHDLISLERISRMFYDLKKNLSKYGMTYELENALNQYYSDCILDTLGKIDNPNFHINQYMFPAIDLLRGKKVIIYGAGKVGKDYYDQLSRYKDIEIVGWVDKNASTMDLDYFTINEPESIRNYVSDIVLIAVNEFEVSQDIKKEIIEFGIDIRKVIWREPDKTILY